MHRLSLGDALALGESTQRLLALAAWWETPFFTDEERAALKLAEEVTCISGHGVSDETYENALKFFDKQGVTQLIFIAITINGWNRIAIPVHMVIGVD